MHPCTNKDVPSDYHYGRFVDQIGVRLGGPFQARQVYTLGQTSEPAIILVESGSGYNAGRVMRIDASVERIKQKLESGGK
jgi:hypothetical protein